jgi:hypothetical protein
MRLYLLVSFILVAFLGCSNPKQSSPPVSVANKLVTSAANHHANPDSIAIASKNNLRAYVLSIDSIVIDPLLIRRMLVGIWQVGGDDMAAGWNPS